MATTQARAAGPLTGPRYVGFDGKTAPVAGGRPVGLLMQASAFGAGAGRRYGSFAGRQAAPHPVAPLTTARSHGAFSGTRYSSFAGRQQGAHPVGRLTVCRTHGAFSGRRYSSFAGRAEPAPTEPAVVADGANAIAPRRRVRRWQIHDAPAPAQVIVDVELDDEEALLAIGLL